MSSPQTKAFNCEWTECSAKLKQWGMSEQFCLPMSLRIEFTANEAASAPSHSRSIISTHAHCRVQCSHPLLNSTVQRSRNVNKQFSDSSASLLLLKTIDCLCIDTILSQCTHLLSHTIVWPRKYSTAVYHPRAEQYSCLTSGQSSIEPRRDG